MLSQATADSSTCRSTAGLLDLIPRHVASGEVMQRYKRDGIYGLGESWVDGHWHVEHLDQFMHKVFTSPGDQLSLLSLSRLVVAVAKARFLDRQAGKGAFRVGEEHYDLGNDLFEVMLDPSMSYTCGYWVSTDDLESAQANKLELLCQKLELEPGMRVLDIGCGWGNFAHHAASKWNVEVTGITISREQAAYASQRCSALPVDIRLQDYRTLEGQFDRVVSIEMIEAVGRRNIPRWYGKIDQLLKPGGRFALQAITGDTLSRTSDRRLDQYIFWLVKNIFPDGCLPRPSELAPRGTQLRIESWERMSSSYDKTLMDWHRRFEEGWPRISQKYGERFRRRWQFYLLGCAAAFRAGLVDVNQVVYSKAT